MIVGLIAALLSAIGYGIASVLQAMAARRERDTGGVDPRLLARLIKQGPFIAGITLDCFAFAAQFLALRTLPVFVVQAIQASNLAVTAVVSIPLLGMRLRGREWAAVGAVCAGLALLGVAAGSEHAAPVSDRTRWALLIGAVVVSVIGFLAGTLVKRRGPVVLGFVAGLGFGVVALAARVITNYSVPHLLRDPAVYALVIGGVISFLFYATGLQRGKVTTVTAAVIVGETLLPSLVGIIVLGDRPRSGMAVFAVIGFLIAVAGAIVLARFGEPEAAPAGADASTAPDASTSPGTSAEAGASDASAASAGADVDAGLIGGPSGADATGGAADSAGGGQVK
jgi:drug/metabolite transporter (DMT)-like permease